MKVSSVFIRQANLLHVEELFLDKTFCHSQVEQPVRALKAK